jgi:uncharacterized membrane protein YeiH
MMEHPLFVLVDLLGTVAFAISGAAAAMERRLDLFGVYAVAFMTVVAEVNGWFIGLAPWFAIGVCFVIRFLAVRYSWGLPVVGRR